LLAAAVDGRTAGSAAGSEKHADVLLPAVTDDRSGRGSATSKSLGAAATDYSLVSGTARDDELMAAAVDCGGIDYAT
jgi:hypothetical protein